MVVISANCDLPIQHYGHSQVDILNPELSIFPDYLS